MEEDAGKSLHDGFAESSRSHASRLQPQRRAAHRDRHAARPALAPPTPPRRSAASARSSSPSASTTATWKRAACAATPTSRSARSATTAFGVKTELKNLNSFRHVQRALEFEIERHIAGAPRRHAARAGNAALRSGDGPHDRDADQGRGRRLSLLPGARSAAARHRRRRGSTRSARALPELPEARRQRFVGAVRPCRSTTPAC